MKNVIFVTILTTTLLSVDHFFYTWACASKSLQLL